MDNVAPGPPPDSTPSPGGGIPGLRGSIIRGSAIFLASRLASQIFQWLVTIYVVRLLQPADYGLLATVTIFIGLADLLAEAGLSRALIHKANLKSSDAAEAFTISLCLSAVIFALLWIVARPVADYLGRPDFAALLRVVALVLWLAPLQAICSAKLEREFQLAKQSLIIVLVAFAQGLLVFVLAHAGYGVWSLAAGALCGRVSQCLLSWHASRWRPALAWPSKRSLPLLRYGWTISLITLLWFAQSNADIAVIAAMLGAATLGYYALAIQLISLPADKLAATVNQVAFAVYCRLQADPEQLNRVFIRVVSLLALVSTPALTGLALIADDAVPLLLGSNWRPAVVPFQLLAPIGMLQVIASTFPPLLNALGRPDITLRYAVLRAVAFPSAFLIMGWAGGVAGVCIAWLCLLPAFLAGLVHWTRATTGIGLPELIRPLTPIVTSAVCMAIAVHQVRGFLPGDDAIVPRLVAAILTGVVTFCGCIYAMTRDTLLTDISVIVRELRGKTGGGT